MKKGWEINVLFFLKCDVGAVPTARSTAAGRRRSAATVEEKLAMELTMSFMVVLVLLGSGLSVNGGKSPLCPFLSHI